MRKKIAVFSKRPEFGKTKTRLIPPLSLNEAKELSEALLKDTIKLTDDLDFIDQKIIYFYPFSALEYFKSITSSSSIASDNKNPPKLKNMSASTWMIKAQKGKDLGERLANSIFEELNDSVEESESNDKIQKLIIIGSDSPAIQEKYIREAFLILESEDFVLGPAEDGGFYLIGTKNVWPGIFKSVRWSSSHTLKDVIINLERLSLKFKLLPEMYDVDEIEDIKKLNRDIKKMRNSHCSNTRSILNKLNKKLKLNV